MTPAMQATEDFPIRLTPQQRAFVAHRDGPALLLAVPGSGKTTAIVCRVASLIRSGVPKNAILTMTFTRAAATDMRLRFAQLFPELAPVQAFHTIHGFSWRILQAWSELRGRPMPEILSEDARNGRSRMELLRRSAEQATGVRMNEERLEQLSAAISLAKNRMVEPEALRSGGEVTLPGFCESFRAYEAAKKTERVMDYDDLLTATLQVLRRDEEICGRFRRMHPYIQVDEAQDNSVIQHRIVEMLAAPAGNLVLIGDEDQSIYVWRGADPSGLLTFRDRHPGAAELYMETNFRSAPGIVTVADRIIRANRNRAPKRMVAGRSASEFSAAARGADAGRATPRVPDADGTMPIRVLRDRDAREQYRHLAAELAAGMGTGSQAVLYRTNRSAFGIADALERAGVPFRLRDFKDTFSSHPVTRDLRSMMRLAADPFDRDAFLQVYPKLGAYLPKTLRGYMNERAREGETVWKSAMRYPLLREYQKRKLDELERLMKRVRKLKPELGLPLMLKHIDYDASLDWSADALGMARESLSAVRDLLMELSGGEPDPAAFLARLDRLRERMAGAGGETSAHAVVLSTIHAAKGLEFDEVQLVDLLDAEFPGDDARGDGGRDRLEEERRLFYVAMTRAKRRFTMRIPDAGGGKAAASRFVDETEKCMAEPAVAGRGKI